MTLASIQMKGSITALTQKFERIYFTNPTSLKLSPYLPSMSDEIVSPFLEDITNIQGLDIVPTILELICKTTGMGFSAVARVTDEKWIACAVRDEISFGLKPGGELILETTICNEIKGHRQPVIIDEVASDDLFRHHHTPAMYGFQSYISIPIILKNGQFFGTLCAIDPRPFPLKTSGTLQLFTLFADLISYHLLTLDQIKQQNSSLQIAHNKLEDSIQDMQQISFITSHTFQEPLRKMRLFSDLVLRDPSLESNHPVKNHISKISSLASSFSDMITQLMNYSGLGTSPIEFQQVDLNKVLNRTVLRLHEKIEMKGAIISADLLHTIPGTQHQLNQLFYYILDNALTFHNPDTIPVIRIYSEDLTEQELAAYRPPAIYASYCKVCIEDNGIGIPTAYIDNIFDFFVRLNPRDQYEGLGMGLSQSKKIMRNHDGAILIHSVVGEGSTFSLLFPLDRTIH